MNLFKERLYIMNLFLAILVCCLGCMCGIAFGQLDEAFTSSVNFPDIGITCIGNLAVFITVILGGQFTIAGESLFGTAFITMLRYEKLKKIAGLEGLTTCSKELRTCDVIILSKQTASYSMQRLFKFISDVCKVHFIFLQCRPLQSVENVSVETCQGNHCRCIVFETVEEISIMLSRRMPGTIKRLSDSLCLLPCLHCLRNGCHGCKTGLLHVEKIEHGRERLREGESLVEFPASVSKILDRISIHEARTCLCIPLRSANEDKWTNLLIKFFKPEPKEFRGAVVRNGKTNAFSALKNYKNGSGECNAVEEYKLTSLFMVPRLTIAFIQIVLTFWFKVDGFSSFLLAEKALANYVPRLDQPHQFLAKAHVKSNAKNTDVCQVLFFRHDVQKLVQFFILEVLVTSICSITWAVRVALKGGDHKWYHIHSMAPSKPRILVILAGICIALVMDGFDCKLYWQIRRMRPFRRNDYRVINCMICVAMFIEILSIVVCSAIGGVMGMKAFGRWVYSALQCLVWLKAGTGSMVATEIAGQRRYGETTWWYRLCGLYVFASSFLLNAILAGVRSNWGF